MGGLGGVGLILGGTFGWFTVVSGTGLVEIKELRWYLEVGGLGGTCVVWGSIRLAWMVLGWFVMVSGLGWYWARSGGKWVF